MPGSRIVIAALLTAALGAAGCGETTVQGGTIAAPTSTHAVHRDKTQANAGRQVHQQTAAKAERNRKPVTAKSAAGTAAAALAKLSVKGRAPKTRYARGQFGDGWIDIGGCDTRDRILTRDLTARSYLDDCRVESGTLGDPYTGGRIQYTRGGASEVDIDHVVSLSDAWQKGAQQWALGTRVAFANDPLELLAVDAHENRSKGDGDAATWLPPSKAFRCAYVARQVAVKTKYKLWVTQAEKDAIGRVLATCPGQKLTNPGAPIRVTVGRRLPRPTATSNRRPTSGVEGSGSGHVYANCAAARAAGVTPILRGTPDYIANPNLDRDHDGVACES